MLFKLARRNIWRNKVRTIITLLGVIMAVVLSTLMSTMKEGMYENMIQTMVNDFAGYAQLNDTAYVEAQVLENTMVLNDTLLKYLESNSDLDGYVPRITYGGLVYKDTAVAIVSKRAGIVGIDVEKEKSFISLNKHIVEGRFLDSNESSVVLGQGLAERLKVSIGDSIILSSAGYQDVPAYGLYEVKGLFKMGSPELSNQLMFMPIEVAQFTFNLEDRCTDIVLHPKNPDKVEELVVEINNELGLNFIARDWKELNKDLLKMIETDRVEGYVFMFILYMVITFGLFGTMLMMLSERKKEFGVLISVGMKRVRLGTMVWMELISISFMGAIIGMAFSFPISAYFHYNPIKFGGQQASMMEEYGIEPVLRFSIEPWIFGQQGMIVFFIASVIAIYPFFKILKLNTLNAMRG